MEDVLTRPPPPADHRILYGPHPLNFGDLRLPALPPNQKAPVLVFIHGGWWKNEYPLDYGGHLCAALKADGIATWSIEYRRVGDPGGGFPGTLADTAAAFDFLPTLAKSYQIDLTRIVVMGHSAGGHLAFWLAGRHHLPETGPLTPPATSIPMRAAIALAGAVDLRLTIDLAGWFTFAHDKQMVLDLMGASPKDAPDRYRAANPGELLPLAVPQFLFQGTEDDQIPPQLPLRWAERGHRMGEQITVDIISNADHMDVVDPLSKAWPRIRATILNACK